MKNRRVFLYKLIATGFGLGYSPIAPGTVGAIGGLGIWLLVRSFLPFSEVIMMLLIVIFFIIGFISANYLETKWGIDSQKIVIDEYIGMWISLLYIPFHWQYIVAAFILFRAIDIIKIFPTNRMQKLRGGFWVMFDDVIAGFYANILIQCWLLIYSYLYV